jgi:hypothetical protein
MKRGDIELHGRWSATADHAALRWALDGTGGLSLAWRLHFLARCRADASGAARFDSGEIRELLKVKSAQQVSNAIRAAVRDGILDRGSNAGCLVLPYGDVARGVPAAGARPAPRT